MNEIAIRGVYKQNSRGRAYLIWYDKLRKRHIVKIQPKVNIRNGETVNVIGSVKRNHMVVRKIIPCIFEKIHRLPKSA